MIINNPNALRSWLTTVLKPICVADPPALARYVFALLKKDKPVKELKKIMLEQLNVFLGIETKPFLERLFTAIATEEYLSYAATSTIKRSDELLINNLDVTTPISNNNSSNNINSLSNSVTNHSIESKTINANNISDVIINSSSGTINTIATTSNEIVDSKSFIKNLRECTPPLSDVGKTKEIKIADNGNSSIISSSSGQNQNLSNTAIILPLSANQIKISPTKTASDKENQPRESRKRRASLRSRSRTRSRSPRSVERARRSRSRDRRLSDREKSSRQFRNKSPPPSDRINRSRPDRRGSDRSPRNFGKNRTKSHSGSRSRSGSPERRKISRSTSPPTNENCSPSKRQRCRDFDEKGYCVRGETCPWDHGINPVVLEDINNPVLISMPPHLREYNPDAPDLWNRGGTFGGPRTGFPLKPGTMPGVYPRPPGLGFRGAVPPFPFQINSAATTPLQRELIPVPVVDANAGGDISAPQQKRRYEPEDSVAVAEGPTKRKIPINSRLGPRVGPQQNCSLELRKVPRGMNTITHLNNHFSKFGKIVNINICYDNDQEAAVVTFSTHAEANVAYRSTEAVLNNRFIKVFWHSPNGGGDISTVPTTSVKEEVITNGRKLSQYHLNNIIPAVPSTASEAAKTTVNSVQTTNATTSSTPSTASTTTTTTVATAHVQQGTSLRKNNRAPTVTNAVIRKKQEEQVKAAVQLAHGLHKRKHELLQEYLKQMKQALELVERVDHADPQRAKLLETVKNLQGIIEKLKKEINQEQQQIAAQISNQPPAKKSKEQQKKELLDIELELIAQQQEGNDTTAIQKRLDELQKSLGTSSHKPTFSGRSTRMRTAPPGSTSVDRRPKTILITGFASEDNDLLLGHFKHFGEITKNEIDRTIPSLKISYATRASAEKAVTHGRNFKEKCLQISWVTPTPIQNASASQQKLKQLLQQQRKLKLENNKITKQLSGAILTAATAVAAGTLTASEKNLLSKASPSSSSAATAAALINKTTSSAILSTATGELDNDIISSEIRLLDEEEEEDNESEDRSWRR